MTSQFIYSEKSLLPEKPVKVVQTEYKQSLKPDRPIVIDKPQRWCQLISDQPNFTEEEIRAAGYPSLAAYVAYHQYD